MSLQKNEITGLTRIFVERQEQINKHGFTLDKDQFYSNEELAQAAVYCLTLDERYYPKTWDNWFRDKVLEKSQRMSENDFTKEMCSIAGAFCAAQIDYVNLKTENNERG